MKSKHMVISGLILLVLGFSSYWYAKKKGLTPQTSLSETAPAPSPTAASEAQASPTETPSVIPVFAQKLKPEDQRKIVVLKEILASRNDNDPRMDTDLIHLSPELKQALVKYYGEMAAEKRNDRGTIVFLIGRELNSKADVDFLKGVLMEKACLSLQDCSKSATASTGEAVHLDGINEVTANYPQIMAVRRMVESYRMLKGDPSNDHGVSSQVLDALKDAAHSPNPKSSFEAENAYRYLTGHHP